MTTSFPTGLDSFSNPTSTDNLDQEVGTRTHSEMHGDINDAVEALQTKVGVDSSAVTTSLDYYAKVLAILKTVVDAKGDILIGTAADTIARLAVGTDNSVLMADSAQGSGVKWATNVPRTDATNTYTENQTIAKASDTGILTLRNETATPPSETIAGRILNVGKNDAGSNTTYAEMRGVVDDDTAGSEDGWMELFVRVAGTVTRCLRWRFDGTRPAICFGNDLDTMIVSGAGTPEGAVTAGPGSIFLRNDGGTSTSLYVKETGTGNTGWVAK